MEFTKEMMVEIIRSLNEMISRRIEYSYSNDSSGRLKENERQLQNDYKLLEMFLEYKKELEEDE